MISKLMWLLLLPAVGGRAEQGICRIENIAHRARVLLQEVLVEIVISTGSLRNIGKQKRISENSTSTAVVSKHQLSSANNS
jgi:hypothetical protein